MIKSPKPLRQLSLAEIHTILELLESMEATKPQPPPRALQRLRAAIRRVFRRKGWKP